MAFSLRSMVLINKCPPRGSSNKKEAIVTFLMSLVGDFISVVGQTEIVQLDTWAFKHLNFPKIFFFWVKGFLTAIEIMHLAGENATMFLNWKNAQCWFVG